MNLPLIVSLGALIFVCILQQIAIQRLQKDSAEMRKQMWLVIDILKTLSGGKTKDE